MIHQQARSENEDDNNLINEVGAQKNTMVKRRAAFKIQPQVTYLQAPLLEYAPFVISQIKASGQEHQRTSYKDSLA